MEHVLEVRGLVHRYGDHTALAGVDLTVKSGECVALLGPNGAGKTTFVRNVIGLIEGSADLIEVAGGNLVAPRPAAGSVSSNRRSAFRGHSPSARSSAVRPPAGVVPRKQPAKPSPRWAWPGS